MEDVRHREVSLRFVRSQKFCRGKVWFFVAKLTIPLKEGASLLRNFLP